MQHALTAPVLKAILSSAAVLAASAFYATAQPEEVTRRLILDAPAPPENLYLTAWDRGDVLLRLPDGPLRPIRFTTRAYLTDGCRWEGTETLIPLDATHYAYDYAETILGCEPGAIPALKTPRQGIVTVAPR